MKKIPIGVIDVDFGGMNVLYSLKQEFPYEDFIYLNDIKNLPYEGKEHQIILKYIKKNVEYLLSLGIKALIIVSDTIIEYGSEYLESLDIPVISLVQSIIDYVNLNYENKNMILCTKDYILKANLYQKNIKYGHLSSASSNKLDNIIENNKIKTMKAFNASSDIFKQFQNRDFDVFIYTTPWIELVRVEILEFLKVKDFIKVSDIIASNLGKLEIEFYKKGQGKLLALSTIEKEEFVKMAPWFKLKYKYLNVKDLIEAENEQNRTIQKDNQGI